MVIPDVQIHENLLHLTISDGQKQKMIGWFRKVVYFSIVIDSLTSNTIDP